MPKIKFVKFYTTGSNIVDTYFPTEKVLQKDEQTHQFSDARDALSKSTTEVFTFWDNVPVGVGLVTA